MKLKGIWVAIAVICVAGIGITDYSVRHLAAGGTSYVSEERMEQSVSGQADLALAEEAGAAEATEIAENAIGPEQAALAAGNEEISETEGATEAAGTSGKEDGSEEAAEAYTLSEQKIAAASADVSVLGNSGIAAQADMPDDAACGAGTAMEKEETQAGTKAGILAQLAELDAQAEERRNAAADGSANTQKGRIRCRAFWKPWSSSCLGMKRPRSSQNSAAGSVTGKARQWPTPRNRAEAHWRSWNTSALCGTLPGNVFTHWLSSMKPFWMGQNKNRKQEAGRNIMDFCLLFPLAESVKNLTVGT